MQTSPTPLRRISEDQKWHYLEHGGLDGSELRGEIMEDSTEFDVFVSKILVLLERHGKVGLEKDCGYYVNRYAAPDFFPCIEVKAVDFVTLELISQLHAETSEMPAKYRIDVCNALGYWNEDLNIFIEHDVIYWYSASDDTAVTVGLMSLAFLPSQ